MPRAGTWAAMVTVLAASVVAVSACTASPAPTDVASTPAPTATSSAPVASPTLSPSGGAADNQAYFDLVNERLVAADEHPGGKKIVDNLVDAGFPKSAMQVTPDTTAIGLTADAIEFSVKFGKECLVGQVGESFGYSSVVAPVLTTGKCLVGETRAIDW